MIDWGEIAKSPDFFPERSENIRLIQTHISWVFVLDDVVYKIKKPVDFGFLDFSTLEKRRYFCEREVELNRRLSPEIYLGVVPIYRREDKFFIGRPGEGAEVVEYAVKMRKLPEDGMMGKLIKERKLTGKHIDLILDVLVPFFKSAETGENVNKYGKIDVIKFNTEENFEQTRDFVGKAISEYRYNFIMRYTREFIEKNFELFERRIKEGYIRDGHGDLYSANICFDDLRKVYIFDCIEFNERFRCGDVALDIAFLTMDLDFHGYKELSTYFIENYIKLSGDSGIVKLLDFYKCYRAYVRGKIGCFTWADEKVPPKEREHSLEMAKKYFDLAYLYAGGKPKCFVFFGLSCTGKSTLANSLKNHIVADVISSDFVRKKLLGIPPEEHHYEEFDKGIYSPEITERTYDEMIRLAKEKLSEGRDVILDATFRDARHRQKLIDEVSEISKLVFVLCKAKDEVIKERFRKREKEKSISDARFETYLKQKEVFSPPENLPNLVEFDTSERSTSEILQELVESFLK